MTIVFGLANMLLFLFHSSLPYGRACLILSVLNLVVCAAAMFRERLSEFDSGFLEMFLARLPLVALAANAIVALLLLYVFVRLAVFASAAGGIAGMGVMAFLLNPFLYVPAFSLWYVYGLVKEQGG